jgi:predicted outer membrane repeat protein
MVRGVAPTRMLAVLAAVTAGIGAAALALPAAAQTGGGSTTTSTTAAPPVTTTLPQHAAGPIGALSVCTANSAATYVTAVTTTASALGCSDGAGHQVVNITASFTLAGTQGAYTGSQPFILNGNGFTINGNAASRVLVTATGGLTTINNTTFTNGVDLGGRGAAVRASSGGLAVNGSTFTANNATNGGGAISVDNGPVTITNSTFVGNTTTGDEGGAIRLHGNVGAPAPVMTISGSTFSTNTSGGDGGAVYSDGTVHLVNSTLVANRVLRGGVGGGVAARGVTLAYTDLLNNVAVTAGNGQALRIRSGTPGTLQSFGSVIVAAAGGGNLCSYQSAPAATSTGYNYLSDSSCFPGGGAPPAATDLVTTADPQLGALANNGGPTLTALPAATSPLIDRIPLAACQTPPLATGITTDQRGFVRPSGPGCDIGAVEVAVLVVTPRFTG